MSLDKLGNSKIQNEGNQPKTLVHDDTSHDLLAAITKELRGIREILSYMSETNITDMDLEENYDNS